MGRHPIEQVRVPAGVLAMGDHNGDHNRFDGELPIHAVTLAGFEMDATTVTNDAFAAFVAATGYVTEAEQIGFSAVFHLLVAPDAEVVGRPPQTPWWIGVRGADWRRPGGGSTTLDGLADHPVVHVSWNDAQAYCAWAGRALPTEAQWEWASRGGLVGARFPWGDDVRPDGAWRCNIWQGTFPTDNTLEDGHLGTAPVRAFPPNDYGLFQTVGNVWEWCADWYSPTFYTPDPVADPTGPASGEARVLRGGSFLCHDSYCNRYRNAARSQNTPDSSMSNAGFRTISRG